ncbi:Pimeloyl-[acyl-carrier protein] methyl ester esterase [Marinobacter litoralis]|uniref:Pimeloyl-[acyl-carrier protein] methyl ester esterase n=1 Tax=Marinobacter litoralis TaxID=187981 RepID=A0A3M2REY2_9GAMM|nr:alpha/beta hydrolase [Marinobacter litoralis]RMJ03863.1 Pimeloyl-[acyl-carrier protein] methyl ester esterase [Marinobacter litoralis]
MDWLLIRGLARESAHWGDWPEQLRRARPVDKFHTVDLPGTGLARDFRSPTSIVEARQFADRVTRNLPRPLGLIGLSLGGMVALDWALNRPEDCASLVLISSSSRLSSPWRRMRPVQWTPVMRMLTQADSDKRERAILALTSNRPISDEVARQWQTIQRERPVRRGDVIRQLYAASCYKPPRKVPKMPTLVLASYRDRITDWRCSRDLAKSLECPLELHPDAGHDLPLDDSPWLIEQLKAYFPFDECVQARTN